MIAAGSMRDIKYIVEVTENETPATPTMDLLRNTGGSGFNVDRATLQSNEFRSDRAIVELRMGQKKPQLSVPFELSYGSFDSFLEAALGDVFTTNVLKCGTSLKSFTIEEAYTDIGVYLVGRGMKVNQLSLNFQPNSILTGQFDLIGYSFGAVGAATIATVTNPANSNPVFDTFTGALNEAGSPLAIITGGQINLNNGLDAKFPLFSQQAYAIGAGRTNVTGNISAYFTNKTLLEKFLNETESSLTITCEDSLGNEIEFHLPKIKYTGGARNISENEVVVNLPFQALHDATDTTLKIIRTAA